MATSFTIISITTICLEAPIDPLACQYWIGSASDDRELISIEKQPQMHTGNTQIHLLTQRVCRNRSLPMNAKIAKEAKEARRKF